MNKELETILKWNVFIPDVKSTYPTDNEEKIVCILFGDKGFLQRDIIFSDFQNNKWSNCDCGEIVYAWANKPEPLQIGV